MTPGRSPHGVGSAAGMPYPASAARSPVSIFAAASACMPGITFTKGAEPR